MSRRIIRAGKKYKSVEMFIYFHPLTALAAVGATSIQRLRGCLASALIILRVDFACIPRRLGILLSDTAGAGR